MPSRHLVDPELLPLLAQIPDMSVSVEKLADARAQIAEMTKMGLAQADPSVRVTEHFAPGQHGAPDVRVLIYRPDGLPAGAPVLLQIHGGGFLFGTAELGDPHHRALSKTVGCAVASVDYRLAPETPYPGGLEDSYAVLLWLQSEGERLGLDPKRVALRGESAGGGLAAALALLARDRGGPKIMFQLLVYPMLDDRTGGERKPAPFAGQFVWDAQSNIFAWKSWLGRAYGSDNVPALAAPARAQNFAHLPPTFIATAALDLFIDENLDYARRLMRAGVPTEVYVAPGAFHGFDAMAPQACVSQTFEQLCIGALKRAFGR